MSPVLLRNLRPRYMEGVDKECLDMEKQINCVRKFHYHIARVLSAQARDPGFKFQQLTAFHFLLICLITSMKFYFQLRKYVPKHKELEKPDGEIFLVNL